jgi:phosphoglycolate phosphatase-like HAD superfamily hydrolase/adenine/guanine phosphoribosyltransferase-like PRPP-binding protein
VPIVAAFDFDMTLSDTSSLKDLRERYEWSALAARFEGLQLYPGIGEAIDALNAAGIVTAVASVSPRYRYLDPLLQQFGCHFDEVYGYWEGLSFEPVRGLSGKTLVKAAQLRQLQSSHPGHNIVLIGDDSTDSYACRQVGVPFGFASWSGANTRYSDLEIVRPRDIPNAVRALAGMTIAAHEPPPHPSRLVAGVRVADHLAGGTTITVVDYYKKYRNYAPFVNAHDVARALKDDNPRIIEAFAAVTKHVAAVVPTAAIDVIVPILGSREATADAASRVAQIAQALSEASGIPTRLDLVNQTPRNTLRSDRLDHGERYRMVYDNIRFVANARRQRILLVDDITTTGASVEAYAARAREAGANVIRCFALMKTDDAEPLLNAPLYDQMINRLR